MCETDNFLSILSNISLGYVVNKMSTANKRGVPPYSLSFSQRITQFGKMTPEDFQKPELRHKPVHFHPRLRLKTSECFFLQHLRKSCSYEQTYSYAHTQLCTNLQLCKNLQLCTNLQLSTNLQLRTNLVTHKLRVCIKSYCVISVQRSFAHETNIGSAQNSKS